MSNSGRSLDSFCWVVNKPTAVSLKSKTLNRLTFYFAYIGKIALEMSGVNLYL